MLAGSQPEQRVEQRVTKRAMLCAFTVHVSAMVMVSWCLATAASGAHFMAADMNHDLPLSPVAEWTTQSNGVLLNARSLPPVHINSSWIGNQWIPPLGYRLYQPREMQKYFRHHSILVIGDSTARRTYATLYGILNATRPDDVPVHDIDHPSVIDIGKRGQPKEVCHKKGPELCRKMPLNASNQFDFFTITCLENLASIARNDSSPLWREWVHVYTLVIFILGPWELSGWACDNQYHGRKNSTDDLFHKLFQADTLNGSNTNFVWRTWGSPGTTHGGNDQKLWNKACAHNTYVKALVDKHAISRKKTEMPMSVVSYVDWGQAMLPRLWPTEKRIRGDIDPHYGLEARLSFVQMLINHLVERDRQKKLMIHPWLGAVRNHGCDDPDQGFMTISAPENVLEKEAVQKASLSFCGDCDWAKGISCGYRMQYNMNAHKNSKLKALISAMQNPACNKTITSRLDEH